MEYNHNLKNMDEYLTLVKKREEEQKNAKLTKEILEGQ